MPGTGRSCRCPGPAWQAAGVSDDRQHDVVVYGATGFVGALTARYLAERAPAGARIALAGRSQDKLERLRAALPAAAGEWPLVVADSGDAPALADLAASTRALATTVGPYAKYGLPVVEACARAGTHYADLTGEVLFVREAIDRTDAAARASGARIVHACGYDSIPSDLGVWLVAQRAAEDGAGGLTDVTTVATVRGGISGGTVDSLRTQVDATMRDRAARRLAGDPYALSPDRSAEPATTQPRDAAPPARGRRGTWTAPFVMAPFNTRIVRRSNAVSGWSYGREFRYGERMGCGSGPAGAALSAAVTAGIGILVAGFTVRPGRAVLDRLLPGPGEGPSEQTQARGRFRMDIDATTESGASYRGVVAGRGDPGYRATAVMLGESVLCLALDGERLPDRAGSLTPATAMGAALVDRLRAAGHTYTVEPAAG